MLRSSVRKHSGSLAASPVIRRLFSGAAVIGLLLIIASLIALSTGPVAITPTDTLSALFEWAGFGDSSASRTQQAVIENIRIPRLLLALGAGAGLGVAGATMQGLFRNPLADPGIIGVSAGGALGAVIAISTGFATTSALFLPAFAFVGAAGATALVFAVGIMAGGRSSMASLLLAGVAISSFLGAITSAVILLTSDLQAQRQMLFWLAGSLEGARWESVRIVLPITLAGLAVVVAFARDLNLLLIGEDEARSLGVRVGAVRALLLAAGALLTGTAVAFIGTVAFVGLIVPHSIRLVIGPDHRALLPLSALGGGLFLLIADTLARNLAEPIEIRVGIITALFGAPFFLFLLIKNRSRADSL
ncbi:MAG: iron chelate uptake ABC transporter family permease subunit [Chloroflexi bacterium]|nr:iron chelate uptake ABC transporter family permease subunit [Chloroflexota bacterium]